MNTKKEVVITVEMPGVPEGCFGISKEFGTANWFLHKGLLTGEGHPINQEQASAILALAVGEIESDSELNQKLYAIASPVFDALPDEARVIP